MIAGLDKKVYVLRANGTSYAGWPQVYSTTAGSESSPVIADIDGDGSLDIVLACEEGRLNAWKLDGSFVAGFPILVGSFVRGTPMVGDLDYNGDLELAASCWDQNVYVWDLAGRYHHGCTPWNGFRGNIYNTGWKEFIPATAADQITCVWRVSGEAVELNFSVYAAGETWEVRREADGSGSWEVVATGLRADGEKLLSWADRTVEAGVAYRYRLEAVGREDLWYETEEIMVPVAEAALYQNHPNPFNPSTSIPYTVPGGLEGRRAVRLAVYDVTGALVKTLVSGAVSGGRHEARWDGMNERGERVASGIYFVRLTSAGFGSTIKLVLLR